MDESRLVVRHDHSVISPDQNLDDVTDRFRHLLLHGRKKVAFSLIIIVIIIHLSGSPNKIVCAVI